MIESDSADVRAIAGNRLEDFASALRFLFTMVPHDPDPKVRQYSIMNSYAYPHVRADSFARATLAWMALEDPDPAIAARAIDQLKAFAVRPLREIVDQRLARLKKDAPDQVEANARLEDDWVNIGNGIVLPSFMRIAPEPFAALPASKRMLRILAFGDWGTGQPSQLEAAAAMRAYHALHPFDFAITLGDNFYPEGVSSPSDPRWKTQYEAVYSPMRIPVFGSLGNHDRYNGETPAAEVLYSAKSPTWRMPAGSYTYTAGPAQFWAIDGSDMTTAQLDWLRRSLDASRARWKVVYGHYPLYSASGGGGREGHLTPKLLPVLQGRADVYIAGHHHSMQHIKPIGSLNLFVAGSGGAGSYPVDEKDTRALFARSTYGFSVFEISEKDVTVRFVDVKGTELYTTTVTK
jgi:tartrate-resistant acid phosphatase type 5